MVRSTVSLYSESVTLSASVISSLSSAALALFCGALNIAEDLKYKNLILTLI
jgi:hypothetical protein